MASAEIDVYTHRPRSPNDPYTVLTDQQIRNIQQNPKTFFQVPIVDSGDSVYGPPREGGRYYRDRYVHLQSSSLARDLKRSRNFLYVDEQIRPHDIPVPHDTCRGLASAKWGPQKIGSRTRSHFFGEQIEGFTTIDMYRRPATNYTGRVIMDCGRPGDGYYTQRFPDRASWNCSSAPLNCHNVMPSVYRKTFAEHDRVREAEQTARLARSNDWPQYSEYTSRYLVRETIPPKPSVFEQDKQHAALGQRMQELERAAAQQKWRETKARCTPPHHLSTPVVRASESPKHEAPMCE